MAGKKQWEKTKDSPGIYEIEFSNFRWFFDYIHKELLDYKNYIFRGQRDSSWLLNSALDRQYIRNKKVRTETFTKNHLENFKMATRGRISHFQFDRTDINEWWAIGQHYGLNTPLLDWSESPFVSLFFSFEDEIKSSTKYRVVYAISRSFLNRIKKRKFDVDDNEYIDIINPSSGDNSRLVNQRGLFLSMPVNEDVEHYVKSNVESDSKYVYFYKFLIPDVNREYILKYLNKMNINKLTLFPDLIGASEYVNMSLRISKY